MSEEASRTLATQLGHAFAQPALLAQALTHSSAVNEQGGSSNERLEFLGDAVLGLVVAQRLFTQFPGVPEGVLSRLRASVINEAALAAVARGLGLGAQLVLGRGEERDGGRDKDALLADAVEAIFGAIYLDAGLAAASAVIECLLAEPLEALSAASTRDAKTQLQERVQGSERCTPAYELVSQEGPPHARVFVVAVSWQGREHGRGEGKSKKAAEHAAALAALATLH